MNTACLGFAVFLAVISTGLCALPDYIQVCHHDHQNLSACIIDSIEKLKPRLKSGIPEIQVPSIEPLELDRITIDSLGNGSHLATNLSYVKIWGVSDFKILKLKPKTNRNGYSFRFEVNVPKLLIEGNYEIDSRILFVDIQGKGPFNSSISDYHFECILKGNKVQQNGANHLLFEEMKCNVVIGQASIYLDNLFGGNPVLGRATNDVINDNSKLLFEAIRPHILEALRKRFTEIANKITFAFTFEELFP